MAKNLGALGGLKALSKKSASTATNGKAVHALPLSKIKTKDQVRKKFEGIAELAESMAIEQIQPIIVSEPDSDGKHIVLKGERRFRAATLAGLDTIDAIIDDKKRDNAAEVIGELTENIQREALTPLEICDALNELKASKMSNVEIGKQLGKSKQWVSQYINLRSFDARIIDLLERDITSDARLAGTLQSICLLDSGLLNEIIDDFENEKPWSRVDLTSELARLKSRADDAAKNAEKAEDSQPNAPKMESASKAESEMVSEENDGLEDFTEGYDEDADAFEEVAEPTREKLIDEARSELFKTVRPDQVQIVVEDINGDTCFVMTNRISTDPSATWVRYPNTSGGSDRIELVETTTLVIKQITEA